MSVTLTIKNVPDELAAALRERASRNHRSLQGELMSVLEAVAGQGLGASSSLVPAARPEALAEELQALVAGSRLGAVPWLTREEANERPMRIHQTLPPAP